MLTWYSFFRAIFRKGGGKVWHFEQNVILAHSWFKDQFIRSRKSKTFHEKGNKVFNNFPKSCYRKLNMKGFATCTVEIGQKMQNWIILTELFITFAQPFHLHRFFPTFNKSFWDFKILIHIDTGNCLVTKYIFKFFDKMIENETKCFWLIFFSTSKHSCNYALGSILKSDTVGFSSNSGLK